MTGKENENAVGEIPKTIQQVAVALGAISLVTSCLRILARKVSKAGLWWDDWLIVPATATALAASGTTYWLTTTDVITAPVLTVIKCNFAAYLLWVLALWITKGSILAFYWRLFGTSRPKRIRLLWLLGLVTLWSVTAFFAAIFSVGLHAGNPDTWYQHALQGTVVMTATAAVHILVDIVMLCVPVSWAWNLDISRLQKVFLTGAFLLGAFTTVTSIVRFSYLVQLFKIDNYNHNSERNALWVVIEVNVTIICANVPSLMPLITLMGQAFQRFQKGMKQKRRGDELIQDIIPFSNKRNASVTTSERSFSPPRPTIQQTPFEMEANEKMPPELSAPYVERSRGLHEAPSIPYSSEEELPSPSTPYEPQPTIPREWQVYRGELEVVSPRSELPSPRTPLSERSFLRLSNN